MVFRKTMALFLAALCLGGCGVREVTVPGEVSQTAVPATAAPAEVFSVELLSTGKSDCALILMDDLAILSDAADTDDLAAILSLLRSRGVERLDYLVLSHFDKDHIGAAAGILDAVAVGEILSPAYEESSEEFFALKLAAEENGVPWTRLRETHTIRTANGALLLDPPDEDYGDDNNNSLLAVLTWKERRLVFLGDAEKQRMREFQSFAEQNGLYALPWVFVKLPHHGDSCKALLRVLQAAEPSYAAETVSVFESVEPELTDALQALGTTLYLTRDGGVTVRWDGEEIRVTQG